MDNRTIKFRIWVKSEDKMYSWKDNEDIILSAIPEEKNITEEWSADCEIMQFTGMFDKNNKPIYEGDIVKQKEYEDWDDNVGYDVIFLVKWCNIHCGFRGFTKGMIEENYSGRGFLEFYSEVIGNVFENKELLK